MKKPFLCRIKFALLCGHSIAFSTLAFRPLPGFKSGDRIFYFKTNFYGTLIFLWSQQWEKLHLKEQEFNWKMHQMQKPSILKGRPSCKKISIETKLECLMSRLAFCKKCKKFIAGLMRWFGRITKSVRITCNPTHLSQNNTQWFIRR